MQWNSLRPTRGAGKSQENIIRDFLLPLGLETNHGYGKTPIVNSEEAREAGSLGEALGQCPAVVCFCTHAVSPGFSSLQSPLEARPRPMEMISTASSMSIRTLSVHKGWTTTSGG